MLDLMEIEVIGENIPSLMSSFRPSRWPSLMRIAFFFASSVVKSTYAKLNSRPIVSITLHVTSRKQMQQGSKNTVTKRKTHPLFSFIPNFPFCGPTALTGICTLVTSPAPSKNLFKASSVVLNDRLPTHTEFCLFGGPDGLSLSLSLSAVLDADFCFFAGVVEGVVVDLVGEEMEAEEGSILSCFFCLRLAAWERTGSSSSSSDSLASAASESESESESNNSGSGGVARLRLSCGFELERGGDEEAEEEEEEAEEEAMAHFQFDNFWERSSRSITRRHDKIRLD